MGTDKDWERWGATDPYFGVISSDRFRKEGLDQAAKNEFFATGSEHVERVYRLIEEHFDQTFNPKAALDFGCGVGRLVVPAVQLHAVLRSEKPQERTGHRRRAEQHRIRRNYQ